MGKPRIFIHIHYLEIGGAETALIGLLGALDPAKVEIDLFVNEHRGELMRFVPGYVNLLPEVPACSVIETSMTRALLKGQWGVAFGRIRAKLANRRFCRRTPGADGSSVFGYLGKYVTPHLPSLRHLGRYDLAISFLTPHDMVLDKVDARRKVCWIHTDYSRVTVDAATELPVWSGFDRIVSISPHVTRAFLSVFPSLADKLLEMENILPADLIRVRGRESVPADISRRKGSVTLLTVGRFCYPKNLENIPAIARMIVASGRDITWYIIGYGASRDYLDEAIAREGMEEHVIVLGKRENPYPYIAAADWYVQPSRYEGKSIVVREAQLLGTPVIITDYPTAGSQVKDGVDGLIVPLDNEGCARAIGNILADPDLRGHIVGNLGMRDHAGLSEVEKLYALLP